MHQKCMKVTCFCILLFGINNCIGQDPLSFEDTTIVIPKLDLQFRETNQEASMFLNNVTKFLSISTKDDSVYVYQHKGHSVKLAIGKGDHFKVASLSVPYRNKETGQEANYWFSFDSLGTEQPYLVIHWFVRNYWEQTSYSGNGEYMCHQKIEGHETHEEGIMIVSLISEKILFQGITGVKLKDDQTHYPGGDHRTLNQETINKTLYWPGKNFISIVNHGYDAYNSWLLYDQLAFGIYQLVNDQYVLVRKN